MIPSAPSAPLPTEGLLSKVSHESHRYWAERRQNPAEFQAILRDIRSLLERLQQRCCMFGHHNRSCPSLCSYRDRLENMGCAHVEEDVGEGPELLSTAGFALRDIGVLTDEERIACAGVTMAARRELEALDRGSLCGVAMLPLLEHCQRTIMERKEIVRKALLRRIGEVLGE